MTGIEFSRKLAELVIFFWGGMAFLSLMIVTMTPIGFQPTDFGWHYLGAVTITFMAVFMGWFKN